MKNEKHRIGFWTNWITIYIAYNQDYEYFKHFTV